jgi:LacI family transcriptional regulator
MPTAPADRRVTLETVARAAGLGRTTVSDILNRGDSGRYSAEARQKVARAVRELGYTPSRAAQTMARGRSGVVGLMLTRDFGNPVWARLVAAAQSHLRSAELRMQLAITDAHPDAQLRHIHALHADQVDGLIVGPVYEPKDLAPHRAVFGTKLPIVTFGGQIAGFDCVAHDGTAGGLALTDHLLQRGHRRIAALGVPDRDPHHPQSTRFAAMHARLDDAGLYHPDWTFAQPDRGSFAASSQLAHRFIHRWQAAPPDQRPTAVACHNDQVALTLLHAAREAGVNVPGQLAVTGYDDLPEARFFCPPLTTYRVDPDDQMHHAVNLLRDRITQPTRPPRIRLIQGQLIARQSTGQPAPNRPPDPGP